jgi:hypothetical protein
MDSETPDYVTMQMLSLGEVVQWSATMESTLRNALCSLVGSKFAAIVAAGQSTVWLIEQCRALTNAHREMPEAHREAIKAALDRCAAANERRNHLVHGVKTAVRVSDGALKTVRSRTRRYVPIVQDWTPATIHEAAGELALAGGDLFAAIQAAVSPQMMVISDALAREDDQAGSHAE